MDKNDIIDMPIAEVYGSDPLDIDEVHVCVYGPPEWYQEEDIIPCFEDLQNYLTSILLSPLKLVAFLQTLNPALALLIGSNICMFKKIINTVIVVIKQRI